MNEDKKMEQLQGEYHFQAILKAWLREQVSLTDKEMDRIKKEMSKL